MSISTLDGYIASAKQRVVYVKTASRTTVALVPFSLFDLAGQPGAGTLSAGNTANGVVPDDTVTGYPGVNAFGGAVGYVSKVEFLSSVPGWYQLYDRVFAVGAIAFTAATTTLSAQPSYSARIPGTVYVGTEIWVEVTTAFVTGTAWQVQVTYTNQAGTAARSTVISAAQAAAALTLGKCFQLALQAGDTGVQKIESVIVTNGGTAMTAGNFNVMVLRPLWSGRVQLANGGDVHDLLRTGMPQVFATSALYMLFTADSTSSGLPQVIIEIANG